MAAVKTTVLVNIRADQPAITSRFLSTSERSLLNPTSSATSTISSVALYRLQQVLKRIPVSRSSWFAGILTGRYPRGYSIGPRTTVWKSDEIDQLVAGLSHVGAQALR